MSTEETTLPKPSGFLTLLWALFFFFLFALLVVGWIRRSGPATEAQDAAVAKRIALREELQKADAEKLTKVAWGNQAKGIVNLPIADAKRLFVKEAKTKTLGASPVKVEPSLPMPAPYDPNAAEPAPAALPSAPQGADTMHFEAPAPATAPSASAVSFPVSTLLANLNTVRPAAFPWTATSEITQ